VKKKHPETKFQENNMIKWYLLTSEINNQEIIDYFKENKYFGYDPDSMVFFPQGAKPAVYYDGKILIEDEGKLSLAPIGNGALYS
jgi:UDP-N-acetylglucosamine pyrophosphorylase